MTTRKPHVGQHWTLSPWLVVGAIALVAAALRLWRLGALGIVADENISILAVDGILEHGYPLLPSGMIYLRLGWFGYVVAAFAGVFGHNEFWLRLPAVLFNVAAIPLAYLFASRLFSKPVGLVVAALVALSPPEIEIARLVRMYAPFAFFYLWTTLAIYRRYIDRTSASSLLPLGLALVSVITHQLGFSLAVLFLVPLLVTAQSRADRVWLVASSGVTGVFFVAWDTIISRFMTIHVPPAAVANGIAGTSASGMLESFDAVLSRFAPVSVAFVRDLLGSGSLPLLLAALALVAVSVGAVVALHRGAPARVTAAALAVVAACALQQMNVAVVLVLLYLLVAQRGIQPLATRAGIAVVATIAVSFAAWLAYAFYFTEPNEVAAAGVSTHLRQSIRTLLDFPQYNIMWGLFFEMPLAALVAVVGLLWCVDGAARPAPDAPRAFLLYVFVLPLFLSGSIATTFRELRYVMHFDVFFLTFVALGIWHWRSVLAAFQLELLARVHESRLLRPAGAVALAVLAFAYVPGPVAVWAVVEREHGVPHGLAASFKLPFHPDFRTPAAYVRENRDPTRELLITLQPREFYPYLGDIDYWLTAHAFETEFHAYAKGQARRDMYVDVPIVSTLDDLRAIIAGSSATVWILASDEVVASRDVLTEDIAAYIDGLRGHIVYTGLDGDMRVYRLEPGH